MKTATDNGGLVGPENLYAAGIWNHQSVPFRPSFGSVPTAISATGASWSHTMGAAETFVLVSTAQDGNPSSVTLNGSINMTKLADGFRCSLFYAWVTPGTTYSFYTSINGTAWSMSFRNVKSIGSVVQNPSGQTNDNGNHTITASAPRGGLLAVVSGQWSSNPAPSLTSGSGVFTQRYWNYNSSSFTVGGWTADGTGSNQTISFSNSGQGGCMMAVPLIM